jgi:hypothetical protein
MYHVIEASMEHITSSKDPVNHQEKDTRPYTYIMRRRIHCWLEDIQRRQGHVLSLKGVSGVNWPEDFPRSRHC